MAGETDFNAANAESSVELHALVARLTDADLTLGIGEGWTVSAMLAHLAFYDFRAAALLDRWQQTGLVIASPLDADLINAASEHLLLAIPPRRAAALALEAAAAANQRVAAADGDFVARLQAAGGPYNTLFRAPHRRGHVSQIQEALAK
jgi:hypothetical protein